MKPNKPHHGVPAGATPANAPSQDSASGEPARGTSDRARPASRVGAASGRLAGGSGAPQARPAPRQAPNPIHPADLEQAAYVVAREALGRPLTAESKDLLWTANQTRKEAQAVLRYGRGNIEADVVATGGESRFRTTAGRILMSETNRGTAAPGFKRALTAGAMSRAEAGNCTEFNEVSTHLHARHLGAGDRIVKQDIVGLDHVWARVQSATPEGGEHGSGPAAILDAWADGPVVEPTDSRHASGRYTETRDLERIDGRFGPLMHDTFLRATGPMSDNDAAVISALAGLYKEDPGSLPPPVYADPIPVVSQRFAQRARNAIDGGSPTTLQTSAVVALLESRTPPTREQAEADAAQVVALARELDGTSPPSRNVFRPIRED